MYKVTLWLESKIPYDLGKVGSIFAYILVEFISLAVDALTSFYVYMDATKVSVAYNEVVPSINKTSGLVASAVPIIYPVNLCNFTSFDTDVSSSLITSVTVIAFLMMIVACIAGVCVTMIICLKIYKLLVSKKASANKKSAGNKSTSIVGDIYSALGLILLIDDDVLFFLLTSYVYAVYYGPSGFGCLICLLQLTTCQKNSQYSSIVSSIQYLLIMVIIKTLLLIIKKLILGFFNWTKTGTMFDVTIIRLLATVMFTILSIVVVYTPGLFILKTQYFSIYSPTGMLAGVVNSLTNIGLMLWAGILLAATCYPIMLLFTS